MRGTFADDRELDRCDARGAAAVSPLPRHASGTGPVMIGGKWRTVAGRIAMDQFVVDLGGDEPATGTEAVLFGPGDRGIEESVRAARRRGHRLLPADPWVASLLCAAVGMHRRGVLSVNRAATT